MRAPPPPLADCSRDPPITVSPPPPVYFPYEPAILNNRMTLWGGGDVRDLDVDVIIRWTDNNLTSSDAVSRVVGLDLKQHLISHINEHRAGSVLVTPGFTLRCRFIVHGVLTPRSGNTEQDDAVMHNIYRGALDKAIELGAVSVSIAPMEVSRNKSHLNNALRILLCSIRSMLLRNPNISVVVRTPQGFELRPFTSCECLHQRGLFSPIEEESKVDMPNPDREIRIIQNPQIFIDSSDDDERSLYAEEHDAAAVAAAALLSCPSDTQPLLASTLCPPLESNDETHCHEYESLLRRAQTEDLSSVSGIGCLYQSGVDRLGRPVVIFIGKWFPFLDIDLEKAMLFLIKLLDPIVSRDYVITYFHTQTTSGNRPPFAWLRDVYTVLPYKYKKNLKAFYIVHPTIWTKMMTWWFTTFMAPAIKAKVHSLPGVEYLYSVMARDQLEVPAFITEYDMTINGLHYFQPDTNNS